MVKTENRKEMKGWCESQRGDSIAKREGKKMKMSECFVILLLSWQSSKWEL